MPVAKRLNNQVGDIADGATSPIPGEKKDNACLSSRMNGIVADFDALGIVGESNLLLGLYLVGTSRLLKRPLSAIVRGASGAGKSYTVSEVVRLFPPADVIQATRMTPQALYHMGSVAHKFVVAGERSRVQDDAMSDATAALRQLISEREITKQITEKDGNSFVTRSVTVTGPIAYVETTTLALCKIFPEDLNRALVLGTDETEAQTRAILKRQAEHYGSIQPAVDTDAIVLRHREFQASLQRMQVKIPFATALMGLLPAKCIEARRAGQQLLSMIEAITILHQFDGRRPDGQDHLIARLEDYELARQLLLQPLADTFGVGRGATQLYNRLREQFMDADFTTTDAQKLDQIAGERSVRNWLTDLAKRECIDQVAPGRGPHPAIWRLNGNQPQDTVLPALGALKAAWSGA